ncbi:MAG TPA: hypothetical protein DCR40_14085 [Prolixibacteraceae bacterium]|nr:hypothetical protein [Prolixibacteraceae bacterium]
MEKYIDQIVDFIRNTNDFQFLDITSSYNYKIGDTFSLSVENSRNLTNNNMGATIIDGILQAGLKYDTVVKPRVDKFKDEYREVKTTSQFYELINAKELSKIINFEGQKIDRIMALVKFLKNEKIETEDDFYEWLSNEDNSLLLSNLKGIKTKTIEYLKILTGHKDTVAVDVRLRNFISMCCKGLEISSDKFAYEILMRVAEKLHIEPATLDFSIWSYMTPERTRKQKANA